MAGSGEDAGHGGIWRGRRLGEGLAGRVAGIWPGGAPAMAGSGAVGGGRGERRVECGGGGEGENELLGFHRLGFHLYTLQWQDCGLVRVKIRDVFAKM
jgi:hypothetical protein